jgi:hypothetical protein
VTLAVVAVSDAELKHTRRHFHSPFPPLNRTIVLVGAMALALFVIGPQGGSVDDDGDGNPDIPVVVSGCALAYDLSPVTCVNQRLRNIHGVTLSRSLGIPSRSVEVAKPEFSSATDRPVLRSSCCLRC